MDITDLHGLIQETANIEQAKINLGQAMNAWRQSKQQLDVIRQQTEVNIEQRGQIDVMGAELLEAIREGREYSPTDIIDCEVIE